METSSAHSALADLSFNMFLFFGITERTEQTGVPSNTDK